MEYLVAHLRMRHGQEQFATRTPTQHLNAPAPTMVKTFLLTAFIATLITGSVMAVDTMQDGHRHAASGVRPPAFVATRDRSFADLMNDAMKIMDDGMSRAPMKGDADHDFAAMMIPHHQGAVDMAKAELLYGKNPVLRRLAQEIIVTQSSEITVMQAEMNRRSSPAHPKL